MKKTAFITGITGQDGSYLADLLLSKGYQVCGLVMPGDPGYNISHCRSGLTLYEHGLNDYQAWLDLFQQLSIQEFYHFAGQSHVGQSFDGEISTLDTNVQPLYYILSAMKQHSPHTKLFFAASSEIFKKEEGVECDENTPVRPQNPYGISKALGLNICKYFRDAYQLNISAGILFNHESPRRGPHFVTQKVCLALKAIKAGTQDILELGNLNAERDWGYAPDYVRAIWMMLQADRGDDYIVASGQLHSLREWVEQAAQKLGYDLKWQGSGVDETGSDRISGKVLVRVNPEFYRPGSDVGICGNIKKIYHNLGWSPDIGFSMMLEEMMK